MCSPATVIIPAGAILPPEYDLEAIRRATEDFIRDIGLPRSNEMLMEKVGKKKVRLTDKEASILKYLFRAGDRPVARDVLLNEVWGYNAGVTTHTLETHIYRLRQKIEKDPASAAILITDRGGYRLQP
jgi:DNA-binding response OmpR family regulator